MRHRHPLGSRWRGVAVVIALTLVVIAAGVLAWTAVEADRAQRATAAGTVQDYADFAAFLIAGKVDTRLRQALFYAFYREDLAWRDGERTIDPRLLAEDPQESARCAPEYPAGPWALRIDGEGGVVASHGDPPLALRGWVADTLRALASGLDRDADRTGHLVWPGALGGRLVAYRIRGGEDDGTAVVSYALGSCARDRDGDVVAAALAEGGVLPPTLVGTIPADSLVRARLATTGPETGSGVDQAEAAESEADPAPSGPVAGLATGTEAGPRGGVPIVVELRAGVPSTLLRGRGSVYSRAPLAIGLLAATLALLATAALLVFRTARLVRLRERFVADVSHELRTPLQQVVLFAQLLRIGQARTEDERGQFLAIIEREAVRLIALVDRILAFSRPAADRSDEGPADLADVIRDVATSFRPLLAERGQRFVLEVPPSAPVAAPVGAVHQIVTNLVDNAAKYGPAGSDIALRVSGAGTTLEVVDAGPGIPFEERDHVWRAFYRLSREEGAARAGSGLGLAVVREAAGRYDAVAEIDDAPGGGTVFRVRFRPAEAS
ncbi:MAG TPA: HAMP domain-containing sensor histidine kinase [Longimicrobiales bacterium]|nr:HAMP domain-containing sensor histidine kinase [Longimicrobiales bacterium]